MQNTTTITAEMQNLVDELNKASEAYYGGKPELMTDYEWDKKFDQLKAFEESTGIILPNSPTRNVSHEDAVGKKETHKYPALSLAKTKDINDLINWASEIHGTENRLINLSWKLDGLTLVATYNKGKLQKLVTRGNGTIGTNITHLAPYIKGVLPTIEYTDELILRGELLISYASFEAYNAANGNTYSSPRNLASGSVTLQDIDEIKARNLEWQVFQVVELAEISKGAHKNKNSWRSRMEFMHELGFTTVNYVTFGNIPYNIPVLVDEWTKKMQNKEFGYPVDGLVICYDDVPYAESGEVTGHHATRGGLAYKWQDNSVTTVLTGIEWSPGTNVITPVALFKPVVVAEATVQRASLANISECRRLGIGGPGTEIEVIRANLVIPKVIKVNKTVGTLEIPSTCPACGAPTTIMNTGSAEFLACTNNDCTAKNLSKFTRFVSRDAFNIDGLSTQLLQTFINQGWIKDVADILLLSNYKGKIAALDKLGTRSEEKLLKAVEDAKTVTAERFLYSLSIPLCGRRVSKDILKVYDLQTLLQMVYTLPANKLLGELVKVEGIGQEKAAAFIGWMYDKNNQAVLQKLINAANIKTSKPAKTAGGNGKYQGLTFVITGSLNHFNNRDELVAHIESNGGSVASSVSKNTNYLINNDATSSSSKNKKAQALGIPIITEEQFLAM